MQTNRNNKMEKHVLFKVKTSHIMQMFPSINTKIYFSVFLCLCSLMFLFQFTSAWTDECQTLKSWHPPTTNLWYIAPSLSVCHLKPCSVSPKYWHTCPLALLTSWKVCLWQLQNMCKEFLVDCWSVPSALLPHHDAHSSPKGVHHRCMSAFLKRKSNSKILSPSSCSTLKSVSFLCTKRIVWHNFFQRVS